MEEEAEAASSVKNYQQSHDFGVPPPPMDNVEMGGGGYMLHHHHHGYHDASVPPQTALSLDKLSFADVMQFADFGPKLALNHQQSRISEEENFFLRFPVLSDRSSEDQDVTVTPSPLPAPVMVEEGEEGGGGGPSDGDSLSVQQLQAVQLMGGIDRIVEKTAAKGSDCGEAKNRRKRPRSLKTSEEVESQRMTHIAVERNRRKQMNEHLRVLRSLMPGSYVHRGDQASIIGGAIEFVRELEQLLQCLESQKRRRIYGGGEAPPPLMQNPPQQQQQPPFFPPPSPPQLLSGGIDDPMKLLEFDPNGGGDGGGPREDSAENKSCLADVEVKVLGFDAVIKILSRRRPGQLLKTIAALEELQVDILHTNITTVEQTVLYSFNVKITGETRFTAEDIANSVQQIFSFINASTL